MVNHPGRVELTRGSSSHLRPFAPSREEVSSFAPFAPFAPQGPTRMYVVAYRAIDSVTIRIASTLCPHPRFSIRFPSRSL